MKSINRVYEGATILEHLPSVRHREDSLGGDGKSERQRLTIAKLILSALI